MDEKPASPFPAADFTPGFEVRWETKLTHDIKFRGARFLSPSLILERRYEGGITSFDPASRTETWEFRLNDLNLRVAGEAGDCLLVDSYLGVYAVKRETGEGSLIEGLKTSDRFSYFTGTHAIFSTMKPGVVVMNMATGEVVRSMGTAQELEPCIGFGDSFFAREPGTASVARYIGRNEAGTGRLLKSHSRLLALPEAEPKVLYKQDSAGFVLVSPDDQGNCRMWIYSWSGDLLRELAIEEPVDDCSRVKVLVAPDGSLDRLLVVIRGLTDNRVLLFSLVGQGQLLWSREAIGNRNEEPVIAGNRLFWIDYDFYERGGHIGRFMDLATGESGVFLDEPIANYLATDGRGIFFGKGKQGTRHLAYGMFVSSRGSLGHP